MQMRHASLFSGIGGFDLAAEWMGWENVFSCEIEEFPRKVLQHHFPNTIHYEDIKRTDFSVHRGDIDILTGGFPCQPYSAAGKRLGKNDERHLWPEMYRAICEIAPRYVVGENVRGFLSWNGGLVLDEVYADLEAQGYEVGTFVLPAASINAPHKRERTWIVAKNTMLSGLLQRESVEEGTEIRQQRDSGSRGSHGVHREEGIDASNTKRIRHNGNTQETRDDSQESSGRLVQGQRHNGNEVRSKTQRCGSVAPNSSTWDSRKGRHTSSGGGQRIVKQRETEGAGVVGGQGVRSRVEETRSEPCGYVPQLSNAHIAPNANEIRPQRQGSTRELEGGRFGLNHSQANQTTWEDFPTQPPVCGGDDGFPYRLDNITVSRWRRESIKAYGNAIVPQLAYRIFKAIEDNEQ